MLALRTSIVIDLQILGDTDAYHTLEDSLRKLGFERATNKNSQKLSCCWRTRTVYRALMVLELLVSLTIALYEKGFLDTSRDLDC